MTIEQVARWNQRARARYDESVSEWRQRPEGTGGYPSLSMALFMTRAGEPRQHGYVASTGHSHHYARTKKKLREMGYE